MEENKKKSVSNPIIDAIVGIVFNLIFYYLLNRYYNVIPFLNEDFEQVLPIYNLGIAISIFIHATRVVFTNKLYKQVGELINTGIFVYIAYLLWTIFPFNLEWFGNRELWNTIIRFLIVVPTVITVLATIGTFIKVLLDTLKDSNR
jgi:hypothetical protein